VTRPARPWLRWFPGVGTALRYDPAWLGPDVTAGLILTALLVPQGMAYAELAGLPAVTGLYTTVAALAAYALFGPSRILVLGPDSSLAPLIAAAVLPFAAANTGGEVAVAGMLSILVGVLCVVTGLVKLGNITELLSKPVRIGYINGIALIVLVSQLPKLFGFSTDSDGFVYSIWLFVRGVADGLTNETALAIGLVSVTIIFGARRVSRKIPGVLIAALFGIAAVGLFGLADTGLSLVGSLPEGFPSLTWPRVRWQDVIPLAVGGLGIALVAFADTSAMSTTFAAQLGDEVDANQEIIALGAANIAAGLFQGFPMSASSSRTTVAHAIGSRSQLTGVVGAVSVLGLLLFGNDLLANLPSTTLAAIVIAASLVLFDLPAMRWLWRVRRSEFFLSLGALFGVTVVGVLEGIAIAVVLSLLNFVRRAWRPYDATLGRISGVRGYHDIDRHPEADQIPGLVVYRFDSPLFFANAEYFQRRLAQAIRSAPERVRWVIVAAEPITDIDTTAADTLREILDQLASREIVLAFAELKGPVKDRLRRYDLYDRIGDGHFYPTLGTATTAYVDSTGIEWHDWTDG
jgi:high affinity sulfate transporter 1